MRGISIRLILISSIIISLAQNTTSLVEDEVKTSLINFVTKLSNISRRGREKPAFLSGWNPSTDPCEDRWEGVICGGARNRSAIRKLFLTSSNLLGEFDIEPLCNTSLSSSLTVLHLENNSLTGALSAAISRCRKLTHLHLNSNRLSGPLPPSLAALSNLKTLDISNNRFSGPIPNLSRISGLTTLLVQNNQLSGEFPRLDFSNLKQFNVSNNLLTGHVDTDVIAHFHANTFLGNPSLSADPPPPSEDLVGESESKEKSSGSQVIIFSGYIVLGSVVVLIILFFLCKRKINNISNNSKSRDDQADINHESDSNNYSSYKSSSTINAEAVTSEAEKSSLVVLTGAGKGLRLEELMKAPAEMMGRGKGGSLYKVRVESESRSLVVKRIKNWGIASLEFKQRMERIHQVKHPNVLPPLAFYSSNYQEKLLVYEFQQNGSLFKFLHAHAGT